MAKHKNVMADQTATKKKTPQLVDARRVAALLNVSASTMRDWRNRGIGPPFYQLDAHTTRYDVEDVFTWLDSRRQHSSRPALDVELDPLWCWRCGRSKPARPATPPSGLDEPWRTMGARPKPTFTDQRAGRERGGRDD